MKNVDVKWEGKVLVLRVDTGQTFGPSKTGKTVIVASTEGNKPCGDVVVGLNVYRYPK